MDSKSPLIRLSVFGKLKKIMSSYVNQPLKETDRRLLRGLYRRKLRDFDEDQALKNQRMSLIERLRENIVLEGDEEPPIFMGGLTIEQ
jgi:hypothetical protein